MQIWTGTCKWVDLGSRLTSQGCALSSRLRSGDRSESEIGSPVRATSPSTSWVPGIPAEDPGLAGRMLTLSKLYATGSTRISCEGN